MARYSRNEGIKLICHSIKILDIRSQHLHHRSPSFLSPQHLNRLSSMMTLGSRASYSLVGPDTPQGDKPVEPLRTNTPLETDIAPKSDPTPDSPLASDLADQQTSLLSTSSLLHPPPEPPDGAPPSPTAPPKPPRSPLLSRGAPPSEEMCPLYPEGGAPEDEDEGPAHWRRR